MKKPSIIAFLLFFSSRKEFFRCFTLKASIMEELERNNNERFQLLKDVGQKKNVLLGNSKITTVNSK